MLVEVRVIFLLITQIIIGITYFKYFPRDFKK